jgi:drug/metabolite transporter (DMT)-like permease
VSRTALGIAIMLVATSMLNVGVVLQKAVVDGLPPFEQVSVGQSLKALLRAPRWVAGWLIGLVGVALNMLALGLADLGLVQPLNGFGLVVLALSSWFYLGERLDVRAMIGMALVIAGVVLVGVLLPESRDFSSRADLLACYREPLSLAVLGALVGLAVLTWMASRAPSWATGLLLALSAAAASVAGLTFAKGFTGVLTLEGYRGLCSPAPALLLLLLIGFSSTAMALQQLSLQKGRAVEVIPTFAAASVVLPLLPGWLVFREQVPGLALLTPGLITAGVILLGTRRTEARA